MALIHEFGIIDNLNEFSYDDYTPEKFHCVSVEDDSVQALLQPLSVLKTNLHSLDCFDFGLDYYGITVIPPESLSTFLDTVLSVKALKRNVDVIELCTKIIQAKNEGKYMIHYGI